ncbi:FAD-dependent thymidylate synthase [bacterium]|jgi:thymidylate synthase (FAD)|nr:FAD-dependent thymidylate synthase [bacterium]MBT4291339.1 FAD-dependent thymidylate synthase [bacterium]
MKAEKLSRAGSPELDAILGKTFPVLNDGFVRVVDYMGNDSTIVQAARVSYGDGTKKVSQDRGLIRYLLRHRHTTPFEMCSVTLHVRVPMDAWRQWIRHRTASVNEISTRYSIAIDAAQQTDPKEWRIQAIDNKQGSDGFVDQQSGQALTDQETELHNTIRGVYNGRLEQGIAREQARKDLPLATYTEAYWKMDLHNLLHFLALRMDSHAQKEIRDYATIIGEEIVAKWVPSCWEAFLDYRFNSTGMSRMESELLAAINLDNNQAIALAKEFGWLEEGKNGLKNHRERVEFEAKLIDWNIEIPWGK